jgi:protein disulfide-isomerase
MKPVSSWKICAVLAILASAAPAVVAEEFRWEKDLATAQQLARQTNRLVLIHFGGPWCGPCMMLERNVFSQPGFGRELAADYVAVKIDPRGSAEAKAIATKYGIDRVPADVVTTSGGQLVVRMQSPSTAASYVGNLASVARQVQPERPAASPSQVAGQATSGQASSGRAAARPADDRYAAYYNRQQPVEREPYQPPVQNQAAPASPPIEQAATAQADRYADRYANRYADRYAGAAAASQTADADPTDSQNRSLAQQTNAGLCGVGEMANQAPTNQRARYGAGLAANAEQRNDLAADRSAEEQFAAGSSSLEAKVPPGSPPLALEGYCPVTLLEQRAWQEGDPKIGVIHRQRLYLFANQAAQQKFLANPDNFSPVCRGHDPVLVLDQNQAVQGRREFGIFFNGRIYLFANEATRAQFEQNPKRYSAEIMQAMRQ